MLRIINDTLPGRLVEVCKQQLEHIIAKGVTAVIDLFIPAVHAVMQKAIEGGATEVNPVNCFLSRLSSI